MQKDCVNFFLTQNCANYKWKCKEKLVLRATEFYSYPQHVTQSMRSRIKNKDSVEHSHSLIDYWSARQVRFSIAKLSEDLEKADILW